MPIDLASVVTVLLPGTGSDEDYVRRAFAAPLEQAGAVVVAVPPKPEQLVAGYLRALDEAALGGPIAVGGVSIGAAVATCWALAIPGAQWPSWRCCHRGPERPGPLRRHYRPAIPPPDCAGRDWLPRLPR